MCVCFVEVVVVVFVRSGVWVRERDVVFVGGAATESRPPWGVIENKSGTSRLAASSTIEATPRPGLGTRLERHCLRLDYGCPGISAWPLSGVAERAFVLSCKEGIKLIHKRHHYHTRTRPHRRRTVSTTTAFIWIENLTPFAFIHPA